MHSIDICYLASNGFSIRMITQTNLLGLLSKLGKKVALVCSDKNDPQLIKYCHENSIHLVEFDVKGNFSDENYLFKRKYFLENIEGNTALMEKHIVATRFNTSIHPLRRLRPYYYWLIYRLVPYFPFIRTRFKQNEKRYLVSEKAKKILQELNPAKVISTYPVNYNEAVMLHEANQIASIETWIHLLSWDNISCKGRWPEIARKFIAWGPIMKEELMEYYNVDEKNIFVTGVPHFDVHIEIQRSHEATLAFSDSRLTKPFILFAMSSPRFSPGEIDIVEQLARDVENGKYGHIQLLVRPHPQNVTGNMADQTWLPRLRRLEEIYKNVFVDFPVLVKSRILWSFDDNDMIRLAKRIKESFIIINSGSTICIDAFVQNKPVILTSFDGFKNFPYWRSSRRLIDYPHLKKIVAEGGVSTVRSFHELENAIKEYLDNPLFNIENRKRTLNREIFKNDGLATERVVAVLTK